MKMEGTLNMIGMGQAGFEPASSRAPGENHSHARPLGMILSFGNIILPQSNDCPIGFLIFSFLSDY
ncbi:MAG TPA: hypothetical protein VMV49_02725 [Candidatus Deferrimicrobium sp.]|nr:hypothetical protein [Candidatus Deferrimicrobium sp.]